MLRNIQTIADKYVDLLTEKIEGWTASLHAYNLENQKRLEQQYAREQERIAAVAAAKEQERIDKIAEAVVTRLTK